MSKYTAKPIIITNSIEQTAGWLSFLGTIVATPLLGANKLSKPLYMVMSCLQLNIMFWQANMMQGSF